MAIFHPYLTLPEGIIDVLGTSTMKPSGPLETPSMDPWERWIPQALPLTGRPQYQRLRAVPAALQRAPGALHGQLLGEMPRNFHG